MIYAPKFTHLEQMCLNFHGLVANPESGTEEGQKSIRHKKFKNRAEPGFLFFCFPDPVKALSEDIAGLGVDDVSVIRDGA